VAVVQYTFTHKQYTKQHNETEFLEGNIIIITITTTTTTIIIIIIIITSPASFHETCQWLKLPLNWLWAQSVSKSSGRIATFSLWTGMFRDGISSIPDETVIPL